METTTIKTNTLGDGSKTYTVQVRDSGNGRVIAYIEAVDEAHAIELCRQIDRAVEVSGNF